jgi:hypothetical protein
MFNELLKLGDTASLIALLSVTTDPQERDRIVEIPCSEI